MNLKQLRTFSLVAQLGSLSRAATSLGIAQSLVSRQISLLEHAWGDRLFERTGRGMVLSDFGKRMRQEVDYLLDHADRLGNLARDCASVLTGTVHVGVLPSMSRDLLPRLFSDMKASEPGIHLRITEGFSGDLDEQLSQGRLDMIVVNRYGHSQDEDILGYADNYLVGQPKAMQQFARMGAISFPLLDRLPMILPSTPNGLRTLLDMLGRQYGVQPSVVMEVDTLTAMVNVVMGGHAYTLLPRLAIREEMAAGKLAALKMDNIAMRKTVALRFSTYRPLSKAARLVGNRIRTIVSSLLVP